MIRIQRFSSRAEADLARTVLEANDIPAFVSSDDAGGLHPELPQAFGSTAVVVREEHYAEAVALLDEEFGTSPGDLADLEAAALAAGPADDLARPSPSHSGGVGFHGDPADAIPTSTGRRLLPGLAVVVAAILVIAFVTALLAGETGFLLP